MTDTPEARYGWLCVCGETNRDILACHNCGIQANSPIRTEAFSLWDRIIRADECERIVRDLTDDVQVNGTGSMMMERIVSIVRGTCDD